MRILKYVLASSMLPAMLCGCRVQTVGDGDLVNDNAAEYFDTTNCLNGYYIVSSGSGEGVVDAAGDVVVPVSCERVYFVENEVIAGFAGGTWRFFSTAGDVIAETSGAPDDEPESLLTAFNGIRRAQDAVWEGIVSGYERFCGKCASGDVDFGNMSMVADSLRVVISRAEGRMSEGQRRRIEQAYAQYREAREF